MSDRRAFFNRLVTCLRARLGRVLAAVLLACVGFPVAAQDDVAVTWERAQVALPRLAPELRPVIGLLQEADVQRALAEIPAGARFPVVLYMHGCSGMDVEEESAKLFLMESGYPVFMPDSFARRGRQSNCALVRRTTGGASGAPFLRLAEIRYALDELARLPFVDRVFLVGYSEGGLAVANVEQSPVPLAGIVVMSWHCQGHEEFSGIKAPPDVPVLALIGDNDRWYAARQGRHCGEVFGDRAASRSIVLPGNDHAVFTAPSLANVERARGAILAFLKAH